MALAALNKIGELQKRMLIVLNDNEMSISENVGALNKYFKELQIRKWVQDAEKLGKNILERISPQLFGLVDRAKEAAKFLLHQENPFYAWGIRYVGPVDGHDLKGLVHILEHLKALDGPTLLHVVTKKGKGYKVAEADPIYWHGPQALTPRSRRRCPRGTPGARPLGTPSPSSPTWSPGSSSSPRPCGKARGSCATPWSTRSATWTWGSARTWR